ncbi:hypothetical protein B0H13DRAFT_1881066 [Mycena leptocephala]|nr:hypothetical protein B0H13DRAFT_1881066 [Mycena leptocephala]
MPQEKKQEQAAAVPYPYPPMHERAPWSRLDMASRGGLPFVPPLPLVIPDGMETPDFVGGAGSGSSQTHGADVPSTAPTVGHGYSNSSLNHSATTAPTLGHGHSNSTTTLPLARVHTHSVSATTGAGHGHGYGYVRTDDGHSVFADSPFESESPLHWQDEPALAEAESRPTSMDAAPVRGYGVGSNNEYGASNSNSESNASDGRASPVYGVEYAGYTRGARGSAVYDLDLRGSTLLAYDRDSAFMHEPRG